MTGLRDRVAKLYTRSFNDVGLNVVQLYTV